MIIVTIIDYYNFGNRLQNYALNCVLSNYSKNVVTLADYSPWRPFSFRGLFKACLKKIYIITIPTKRNVRYRKHMFFTKKYMRTIPFAFDSLLRICQHKVPIIVGSDQVWNPFFYHLSKMDTLSSLSDNVGISYAASFGVDELPEEYAPQLAEIGKHFKAVSVREESGKKLLEPYVNDVQVHVDPTLLLTTEEWETVMRKPRRFPKKKYVALYFLGQVNETRRSQIDEFAESHGFEIVEFMDQSSVYYSYGPAEFLWVMQHAEAVFTDSFHGCVFSFLFDKPFVVYDREDHDKNMSSRMATFLPRFRLEDRAYPGYLPKNLLEHDYSDGYQELEAERKRANDYFRIHLK